MRLLGLLHPGGLTCPTCRADDHLRVHRRNRAPVLDYRCTAPTARASTPACFSSDPSGRY